jgi:adenylyltransferase/sulfurtransferase
MDAEELTLIPGYNKLTRSRKRSTHHFKKPEMEHKLTPEDRLRYQRQLNIVNFDASLQEKLKNSRVVVLGGGGVGCPTAIYLTVAGIGHLTIADGDVVEITNLNRQIGYGDKDIGLKKAPLLKKRLLELNPTIAVEIYDSWVDENTLPGLLKGCDYVIDSFDKNKSRLMVNSFLVANGMPGSHAFIHSFCGSLLLYHPDKVKKGACLNCHVNEHSIETPEVAVFGAAAAMCGLFMASQIVFYLTDIEQPCDYNFIQYDLLSATSRSSILPRNLDCPICGRKRAH